MKDPKKAEIRRVLLSRALLGEDGRLYPVPAGKIMRTPIGVGDGAAAVRLFGVTRRVRNYATKDGKPRVREAAKKSMQNIGRGLGLSEQPDAIACLIRYVLTRPVVLTFDYENGAPTLTAWAGRGLTAWISLHRAIRAFEKGLPDTMTASSVKVSELDKAQRKADKERKRAEKAARKEEKAKKRKENANKQPDKKA